MQATSKFPLFFCMLIGQLASSQNVKQSFHSFCVELDSYWKKQPSKNFISEVKTIVYSNKEKSNISSQETGKIMAGEKNSFWYNGETNFFLQNDLFGLMIDSTDKTIYLSPVKELNYESFRWNSVYMDSNFYQVSKTTTSKSIIFKVEEKTKLSEYQMMIFEFDITNSFVKKVSLNFWPANYTSETIEDESFEQPYLEMTYTLSLSDETTKMIDAELKKYVLQNNNSIQVAPLYATYKIQDLRINQTSK